MKPRCLKFLKCFYRSFIEPTASLLALHITPDGFAHDPVRRTLLALGQRLDALAHIVVEFDRNGHADLRYYLLIPYIMMP